MDVFMLFLAIYAFFTIIMTTFVYESPFTTCKEWLEDKNVFGKAYTIAFIILCIPAIVIVCLTYIIVALFYFVYDAGLKNKED